MCLTAKTKQLHIEISPSQGYTRVKSYAKLEEGIIDIN